MLGKRPDGFHEIETVMTRVSLYDTLSLAPDTSGQITLANDLNVAAWPAAGSAASAEKQLPDGPQNIVVRALEALRQAAGVEHGAHVRLTKRIPLAAGMAGGSTDAAPRRSPPPTSLGTSIGLPHGWPKSPPRSAATFPTSLRPARGALHRSRGKGRNRRRRARSYILQSSRPLKAYRPPPYIKPADLPQSRGAPSI